MRIGIVAEKLGVSDGFIRNLEKEGLIVFERSTLGQRVFTSQKVLEIKKIIQERFSESRKAD